MVTEASHLEYPSGAKAPPHTDRQWRRTGAYVSLATIGASLGLLSLRPQAPDLVWNFTESLPVGLYSVARATPAKGDLIAITPTGKLRETLTAYAALPAGRVLLKQITAIHGDAVCRRETSIIVNGATVATAKLRSGDGRTLPSWSGCRILGHGEIFVLAPHPSSFDGRYFGPINDSQIVGIARPLLTFSHEGAP